LKTKIIDIKTTNKTTFLRPEEDFIVFVYYINEKFYWQILLKKKSADIAICATRENKSNYAVCLFVKDPKKQQKRG